MRIMSWNYRGLAKSSTVLKCQKKAQELKPDILFLMETRLAKDKGKQVWVKCGFSDGWEVSRVGFGGRLILAWNQTFCFLWRLGLLKTKEKKFGSSVVFLMGGRFQE